MSRRRFDATYDDLLKLPAHVIGELIDGELIVSPRPAAPHAVATSGLGVELGSVFGRSGGSSSGSPGGWWILDERELHLGRNVVVPDLAGWRRERMPRVPNVPYFELAPDWVCEVISERTARYDRGRKMDIYAQAQVSHLWFLEPILRTLEIFRLGQGKWLRLSAHEGNDRVRAEPFDAMELELGRLWLEPEPEKDEGPPR